jgi:hypothetical protein
VTLPELTIDLLYLGLFVLGPILKLAMGTLLALAFGEGVIHAITILRG